jgi:hypothetical protein
MAYYGTIATIVPLMFIALVFQSEEFKNISRVNAFGGLLAVLLLILSEIISIAALASAHSSTARVQIDAAAIWLGAGFVAMTFVDRILRSFVHEWLINANFDIEKVHQRIRAVTRWAYVLATPVVVLVFFSGR